MMPTAEQTLLALAQLDPDYQAFIQQFPDELTANKELLPDGLAADVVALLKAERAELSKWFEMQPSNAPPAKFLSEATIGTGLVFAAIVFLLRTHIKIEGKHFLIEHKPLDSDSLTKVLDALGVIFGAR